MRTDYRIGENLIKWYTSIALSFSMISHNVSMCMVKIVAVICSVFLLFLEFFFRLCSLMAVIWLPMSLCVYARLHYTIVRMVLYVFEG